MDEQIVQIMKAKKVYKFKMDLFARLAAMPSPMGKVYELGKITDMLKQRQVCIMESTGMNEDEITVFSKDIVKQCRAGIAAEVSEHA